MNFENKINVFLTYVSNNDAYVKMFVNNFDNCKFLFFGGICFLFFKRVFCVESNVSDVVSRWMDCFELGDETFEKEEEPERGMKRM